MLPADGKSYSGYRLEQKFSEVVYFATGPGPGVALEAVSDAGKVYFRAGGQTLHVRSEDGLVGVRFTPETIEFSQPIYQAKGDGLMEGIREFADRVSNRQIEDGLKKKVSVPLGTKIKRDSWSFSEGFVPRLLTVSATGHVFTFSIEGLPTMRVDWKAAKVVERSQA